MAFSALRIFVSFTCQGQWQNVWPLHPSPAGCTSFFGISPVLYSRFCSVSALASWFSLLPISSLLFHPSRTFSHFWGHFTSHALWSCSSSQWFSPHFLNSSNTYCPHCIHLYLSTLSWLFTNAFVYLLRSSVTACAEALMKAQAPCMHLSPPSRLSSTWSLHSWY